MGFIKVTKKDLLRSKLLDPAWYRVKVTATRQATAKTGSSQNHFMEGEILFNAETGDKSMVGTPTPQGWLFNEGAPGFAIGYMIACGANEDELLKQLEENPEGVRFDFERTVGKELDIFIQQGLYEGRTVNKINHEYRRPVTE